MTFRTLLPLMLLLGACDEPASSDDTDTTDTDTDTDTDADTDTEAPAPEWTGTWEIEIDWSVTCDLGFGEVRSNSGTDTWQLVFEGREQELSAKVNGNEFFTLVGAGSEDGLSLCGDFPMYDHEGDAARSGTQNEICLQGQDVISADEVQGVASGPFESRFGADCELEPSDFVLRRP